LYKKNKNKFKFREEYPISLEFANDPEDYYIGIIYYFIHYNSIEQLTTDENPTKKNILKCGGILISLFLTLFPFFAIHLYFMQF